MLFLIIFASLMSKRANTINIKPYMFSNIFEDNCSSKKIPNKQPRLTFTAYFFTNLNSINLFLKCR